MQKLKKEAELENGRFSMKFNEEMRVNIPTILHLIRSGYKYLSLKEPSDTWDEFTNIFTDSFDLSINQINAG